MAYDRRALVGIGGWLAFFIITLCLNALAALVVAVATVLSVVPQIASGSGAVYPAIAPLLGIAKAASHCFMAWRLNARQDASTPPLVIRLLWAVTIVLPLVDALAAAALLGFDATRAGAAFGAGIVRPLIYAAIWTAYLLRSERVANTYAGSDATDRLAAVFD